MTTAKSKEFSMNVHGVWVASAQLLAWCIKISSID